MILNGVIEKLHTGILTRTRLKTILRSSLGTRRASVSEIIDLEGVGELSISSP